MRLTDIAPATALSGAETVLGVQAGAAALLPVASLGRRAGRLQLVGHRGHQATATWGAGIYGRSDIRSETRMRFRTGPYPATEVRFVFANWWDASGETDIANPVQVDAALEGASWLQPIRFNGAKGVSMPAGAGLLVSDPVSASLDADTLYYARAGGSVSDSSLPIPSNLAANYAGDDGYVSPAPTSQVYATGALTTPSGGASAGGFGPTAIVGVPTRPHPAIAVQGDSIFNGTGDTSDGIGNAGYGQRGLAAVPWNGGVYQFPYVALTRGGDTLAANQLGGSDRKFGLYRYCTHLLCDLGSNDIANGATLSAMQANAQAIWKLAKDAGLTTAHCLITPHTTSTDSYATAAHQTPVSGFTVGGVRDQFNAWLKAQAGHGLLDAAIDPNPYVEDAAHPGLWITTGAANYPTADGIHPSAALHAAASAAVRAWASGLSVA